MAMDATVSSAPMETHDVLVKADAGRRQKNYRLPGGGNSRFFVVDPDKLDSH